MSKHRHTRSKRSVATRGTPRPLARSGTLPITYLESAQKFFVYGTDFVFAQSDLDVIRLSEGAATTLDITSAEAVTDMPTDLVQGVAGAFEVVSRILRELFGENARVELWASEAEDRNQRPVVLQAHYGLSGEPSEDDWNRHKQLLERYVSEVSPEVRQYVALSRSVV